jgi:hypothetical protein
VTALRQLVLAAHDLAAVLARLQALLGATAPYRDAGVGQFGLANGVLNAGTSFVEVVSPIAAGTAAGRWLHRHGGDGGYMLMAEVDDIAAARQRLAALDVRVVWEVELPDIVDLHLHPKDVGGTLLALDAVDPPASWRWGGPAWTGRAPAARGGLREVVVAVEDPEAVARRWAFLLDAAYDDAARLTLADQQVRFVAEPDRAKHGIVAATLALPGGPARSELVAGVHLDVVPLEEAP